MPAKHIDEETWKKVQSKTMSVIKETDTYFKETDVLRKLIHIGMQRATDEDWEEMVMKRKKKSS